MLSHRAGLSALDETGDVLDYSAVIAALEKQKPLWPPGTAHGYHARTFGFLVDECVRRITGKRIAEYWRENFAGPLGLAIWIGLPAEERPRTATIYSAKAGGEQKPAEFYRQLMTPGTLVRKTFTSPAGLHSIAAMNTAENRALEIVSFNGIGSASSLAKFYGMLANGGELDGRRYFKPATIAQMLDFATGQTHERLARCLLAHPAIADARMRRLLQPFEAQRAALAAAGELVECLCHQTKPRLKRE